jgi:hypothetical protein
MTHIRLKDWSDLSDAERAEAFCLCLGVAERIQRRFAPFVDLCRADTRAPDGRLRGHLTTGWVGRCRNSETQRLLQGATRMTTTIETSPEVHRDYYQRLV